MEDGGRAGEVLAVSERAKALAAVESFLRMARLAHDCFPGDDLTDVVIYLTVVAASGGHVLRAPDLLAELDGRPLPNAQKRPTAARAVAAATGLPRETVRRKLKALVAAGRLIEADDGLRSPLDVLGRDQNRRFAHGLLRELGAAPGRVEQFSRLDEAAGRDD